MSSFVELVTAGLSDLDAEAGDAVSLGSPALAEECARFLEELSAHATRANLVGTTNPKRMVDELLIDSLRVVPVLADAGAVPSVVVDIGSGAGIPGIPLLLHYADAAGVLVEPRMKRAMFLKHALRATTIGGRAAVRRTRWEDAEIGHAVTSGSTLWVSRAVFQPEEWLERAAREASDGDIVAVWLNEGSPLIAEHCPAPGLNRLGAHMYTLADGRERVVVVWRAGHADST